jgi:hypothetical protein
MTPNAICTFDSAISVVSQSRRIDGLVALALKREDYSDSAPIDSRTRAWLHIRRHLLLILHSRKSGP